MAYRRKYTARKPVRYGKRRVTKRRKSMRRPAAQKIIIQLVGGPGGAVPIGVTAGVKGKRVLRPRL